MRKREETILFPTAGPQFLMKTPSPEQRRRAFRERSTKSPEAISPPSYPVQEKKTPQDGLPSTPTIPSTCAGAKVALQLSTVPARRERHDAERRPCHYCSRVMPQRAPPKKVASDTEAVSPRFLPQAGKDASKERSGVLGETLHLGIRIQKTVGENDDGSTSTHPDTPFCPL
jgi:hypothetical protein